MTPVARFVVAAAVLAVAGCSAAQQPPPVPKTAAVTSTPAATVGPPSSTAAFPLPVFPDSPANNLSADRAARLRSILDDAIKGNGYRGIAAAVIVGGAGTWTDTVGHDLVGNPLGVDAKWKTGSIAKTVVAAEILRLAERDRLSLDDLAGDLVKVDPPPKTNGATIRHLLRMRSGLTSGRAPGSTWEYSNGDYVLLGQVIEGVEQRSLGEVLTSDILNVPGAAGLAFPPDGTVDNAAGPLDADAMSLARWGYALFGGRLLEPESLALMVDFDENTYGMGAFDFSTDFGGPAIGPSRRRRLLVGLTRRSARSRDCTGGAFQHLRLGMDLQHHEAACRRAVGSSRNRRALSGHATPALPRTARAARP